MQGVHGSSSRCASPATSASGSGAADSGAAAASSALTTFAPSQATYVSGTCPRSPDAVTTSTHPIRLCACSPVTDQTASPRPSPSSGGPETARSSPSDSPVHMPYTCHARAIHMRDAHVYTCMGCMLALGLAAEVGEHVAVWRRLAQVGRRHVARRLLQQLRARRRHLTPARLGGVGPHEQHEVALGDPELGVVLALKVGKDHARRPRLRLRAHVRLGQEADRVADRREDPAVGHLLLGVEQRDHVALHGRELALVLALKVGEHLVVLVGLDREQPHHRREAARVGRRDRHLQVAVGSLRLQVHLDDLTLHERHLADRLRRVVGQRAGAGVTPHLGHRSARA